MNRDQWLELCQTAERLGRSDILQDLMDLTESDAHGVLIWLRNQVGG